MLNRSRVFQRGEMYLLPMVKGWDNMYLVSYLFPSDEIESDVDDVTGEIIDYHVVHFLGNPDVGYRGMPYKSPIFKLAYLCRKDTKIMFQNGPELCDPYTATIDSSYLDSDMQMYEDGSCQIDALGFPRRLTTESWERVIRKSKEVNRTLSFQCK